MVCRSCAASFCSLESTGSCACCPMHHLYRKAAPGGCAALSGVHDACIYSTNGEGQQRPHTRRKLSIGPTQSKPKALNRTNSVLAC